MRSNLATKSSDDLQVSVVERNGQPGVWSVEAIDMADDGDVYQAIFHGPEAEKRAREYARFKYEH
jgi:hypothetical protein